MIKELDQGARMWVLEVLGFRGGFAIRQGGGGFYICLDRGAEARAKAGAVGECIQRASGCVQRDLGAITDGTWRC